MLKNYFTIALRNLKRNPAYTAINIGGLALGLACCILIALYVRDELSYDDFYAHADRITFIGAESAYGGETRRGQATPYPLAGALEREVPGIEQAIRTLWPGSGKIRRGGETFREEEGVFHAESGFFDLFNFPFVKGHPQRALSEPNTVVISERLARKYFPNENPIGKTLEIQERGEHTYRITGVARSSEKSYFDFNAVLSFSTLDYAETHADAWGASMFLTFALLEEGVSQEAFEEQLARLGSEHSNEQITRSFFAIPITGLYLSDLTSAQGFRGQWRYLYLFGAVALFTLLLAVVNYVNLATARSMNRAREVGVRKTLGAARGQVARQFLGESVLLCMAALACALLLAQLALPAFNHLFGTDLALGGEASGLFALALIGVALGVGVLAGSYPALFLSRFRPTEVLRGRTARGPSGAMLRQGLVVLQFAVAVVLIIGTAVVYRQLDFMQTKDLGFDGEQVVVVQLPGGQAWQLRESLRQDVLAHVGVKQATLANGVPGTFNVRLGHLPKEVSPQHQAPPEAAIMFVPSVVDYGFVETLGLRLVAGREFSQERSSDAQRAYILNETAARRLGWTPDEAIGKPFDLGHSDSPGEVIGVVKDFHIASLHREIEPVVLQIHESESWSASGMLLARLAPGSIRRAMDHIEQQLARYAPEAPFTYEFLDEQFDAMYRTEQRLGQVFGAFAVIAVLIACLGLFGLAALTAEQRTKEIGIRKVLGASVESIVALLSKESLKLVLIAFVIAAPLAYLAVQRWLEGFAYRIDLGAGVFLLAGAAALFIALLTVSYQALRAAMTNPTEALRSE